MTPLDALLRRRGFLFVYREDYDTAVRGFAQPQLGRFNWALDYSDAMARGNDAIVLWVVDDQGSETRLSFVQMAERSTRTANHLRVPSVQREDRILLMLGDVFELWGVILTNIKIDAAVIPAMTLFTTENLRKCIAMEEASHVVMGAADCAELDVVSGTLTRIVIGTDKVPAG